MAFFPFSLPSSMVMEDNESCGSRVHDTSSSSPAKTRQHRQKLEVYNEVLRRLKESKTEDAIQPGFDNELWAHFNRLPTRYLYHTVAFAYSVETSLLELSYSISFSFVFMCRTLYKIYSFHRRRCFWLILNLLLGD